MLQDSTIAKLPEFCLVLRYYPIGQGSDVPVNRSGPGKPDFIGFRVVNDMQQDIAQAGKPVRLS